MCPNNTETGKKLSVLIRETLLKAIENPQINFAVNSVVPYQIFHDEGTNIETNGTNTMQD